MRNLLRLILPLLMLQGCAGNPVAQQLQRSFDQPALKAPGQDQQKTRESKPTSETKPSASADAQPVDATTQKDRSDGPKPKADQAGNDKAKGNGVKGNGVKGNGAKGSDETENVGMENDGVGNDGEDKDEEGKSEEGKSEELKAGELPPSDLPQEPYRITIRLSAADPASPAEAVTRVLRQAGVPFAVERIERVEP